MWKSIKQIIKQAKRVVVKQHKHAMLFKINKKEIYVKQKKLFDRQIEEDTQADYKKMYYKLLCYMQQIQEQNNRDQPLYAFTKKQGNLFDKLCKAVEKHVQVKGIMLLDKAKQQKRKDQTNQLCLNATVAFFNYQYKHMLYKNALLSGLAVLKLHNNNSWYKLKDYMLKYLAVIKLMQILVIYQLVVKQQNKIAALEKTINAKKMQKAATRLFKIT